MLFATIIAVEGIDSVGKFTQTNLLVQNLKEQGFRTKVIEVPVKSLITYPLIYWMLYNGLAVKFPTLFQIIQFFNKLIFQITKLWIYRFTYSYIILDRWSTSALVYGNVSGVNQNLNEFMFNCLVKPDVTIVLHGRSYKRGKKNDSYETNKAFQDAVAVEYLNQSTCLDNIWLVSNIEPANVVHSNVMKLLSNNGHL